MADARFEDVRYSDRPLRIAVATPEDVPVVAALLQDAAGIVSDITWMQRRKRVAVQVNRFRWEDRADADRAGRAYERVRTAIVFDNVLSVRARGIDPKDSDVAFAILGMTFEPGEDGAGTLTFALAGDGDLALDVEVLDGRIVDLTRPWAAQSGTAPDHGIDDDG